MSQRMKRSMSRASKMSTDFQDGEVHFYDISEGKWLELMEKEQFSLYILGIREEIVNNCLSICYDKYLERQSVAFTVHCAYLAWIKVVDMCYMLRDPGDREDPKVKESWEADEEPETSLIDSWGSQCIKTSVPPPKPPKVPKEPEKKLSETHEPTVYPEGEAESIDTVLDTFDAGEYFYNAGYTYTSSSFTTHRTKSIFTRTLSMSRDSLPLLEPQNPGDCKIMGQVKKKPPKVPVVTEAPIEMKPEYTQRDRNNWTCCAGTCGEIREP